MDRHLFPSSSLLLLHFTQYEIYYLTQTYHSVSYIYILFLMAHRPPAGQDLFITEASWSHTDTPQSVGILWTSDQPDPGTSTWQHTTLTTDRHPCPRRDTKPRSQQASGRRQTSCTGGPLGPANSWLIFVWSSLQYISTFMLSYYLSFRLHEPPDRPNLNYPFNWSPHIIHHFVLSSRVRNKHQTAYFNDPYEI